MILSAGEYLTVRGDGGGAEMANGSFPNGMDEALAKKWFGERFGADRAVSRLWLTLGRFPALDAVENLHGGIFTRFADGTVFRQASGGDRPTILEAATGGEFPEGINAELAARWYGSFAIGERVFTYQQDHPVGRLWLGLGRLPTVTWVGNFGDRRYFRFADGTVIYRPDANPDNYRVMGAKTGDGLYPDGMDEDLARLWFGKRFNPKHSLIKLWLRVGQQRKRFPTFAGDEKQTDGGAFYRFADGTVFFRAKPNKVPVTFPVSDWEGLSTKLEWVMRRADMHVSQGPFEHFSHAICDCYDFAVEIGTEIYPIAEGTVIASKAVPESDPVDGAYHPNFVTVDTAFGPILYAHLTRRDVAVGDRVGLDTLLGLSGTAGTGAHLHLQLDGGVDASPLHLTLTQILGRVGFGIDSFPRS
jgi:hypothetical protein